MALSEPYELDGVTISTTEISVVTGTSSLATDTNAGIYQAWIDTSTMALGDVFVVRVYEKVEATGGTKRAAFTIPLAHAQVDNLPIPGLHLRNGWDVTIQKVSGTDRAFDASIRKVA